jgi:hypothetical protein
MSRQHVYQQRQEAVEAARALAHKTGQPVFWGQYPNQTTGYTVPLFPSGDPREMIYLTLPPDEARRGREWWNAVRWFYYTLAEASATARGQGRVEEAEGLDLYANHLAERTGLSERTAERERDRGHNSYTRAEKTRRDHKRLERWRGDRKPPGADPKHPGGQGVRSSPARVALETK